MKFSPLVLVTFCLSLCFSVALSPISLVHAQENLTDEFTPKTASENSTGAAAGESSGEAANSNSNVNANSTAEDNADREPAQANRRRAAKPAAKPVAKPARPNLRSTKKPTPSAATTPIPGDVGDLAVTEIAVRGNKKIELDAILTRLISKKGDETNSVKIRQDVEALFNTGFFYDIQVDRKIDGTGKACVLTYTVVEKPSLTEINYSGNKEVETKDLTEAAGLKPFEILNMNKVREATEKIQKVYEDKGYFLARINPKIETLVEGESVKLTFEIQENEKVKVKRITFIGNKNLTDGKLKSVMATQEGSFFSFISGAGAYKQDAFDRDVQVVSFAYFNEGYVDVKVDRPQVYVTPDKKGIYITMRIEEGERYKVGTVDFSGDLLFERDDLFNSIEIDGSGWYVHETLLKDLRTLQAKYGDLGYAYANIIPHTAKRERDHEIDITFDIDKGNKVYFGRISMVGNSRTRDKVIRRELTIREGELYNETRKRESLDNVKRLGYFEDVQFNSKTPSDNSDLMDLDIVVKERNTGTIQVGAGYSTYQSFIFNGQVNQINLFGKGQKLGLSVDLSSRQSLFNLNYTEPYFLDTEWSLGVDGYRSQRQTDEYTETKVGGAFRVGHPLAPYLLGYVRYKLDKTEIRRTDFGDPAIYPMPSDPDPSGNANGLTSSATFTLEYDKRNDRFMPTDGVYSSAALEYAGLGGDLRYTKGFFTARYYKKIWWELVFRNNLTYGFIRANDANGVPPYNELFLLGGANSLRGYSWYRVGRRKFSQRRYDCLTSANPDSNICGSRSGGPLDPTSAYNQALLPYGGKQQLYYQLELEFPLVSEAGIRGVVFYDVGQAEDELELKSFQHDAGFGFRWFSPIGPLRFEWGIPLNRRAQLGDKAYEFQFAIGAPF